MFETINMKPLIDTSDTSRIVLEHIDALVGQNGSGKSTVISLQERFYDPEAGKVMRTAKQGGSVINISSIVGLNRGQLPGSLAYASSKIALNSMTKVMAIELGQYKIQVNSISPGLFKSR